MKKTLTRAAVALASAGAIGAGGLAAVAPADAATPNLRLTGAVFCHFGQVPGKPWGVQWYMVRTMKVTAEGSSFKNVHLQELGGTSKFAPLLSPTGKDANGKAVPKSLEITTKWPGCFPSSISGYTISDYAENLVDNFGFWWNLRKIENPKNKQDKGTGYGAIAPDNTGTKTGNDAAQASAAKAALEAAAR
ncbi:hypothetical protein [Gordonia sp. VNK21]|uniref:hypothetical protein n=1 Tax=Gordonia sp. VNK21 TaxID=3382483 RepID=UPI0038D4254F